MANPEIPYVILLSKAQPKPITLVPNDLGSRYKCRQLQSQNVGKNKMMKTVLVNILDVAKEMQLPHPSYLVHFLGYELNVTPHFYEKQPARQQAVLSGEHFPEALSPLVQKFIDTFLLCQNCGLPELLHAVKGKKITARCRGCGSSQEIVPDNEKFQRYVINHPPTKTENAFRGNNKVEKKTSGTAASGKKERAPREQADADEAEGEVEWYSDVSEAAVQQRLKENVPELLLQEQVAAIDPKEVQDLFKSGDVPAALSQFKVQNGVSDSRFAELLFDALYVGKEFNAGTLAKSFDANKAILLKFVAPATATQLAFLDKLEALIAGSPMAKSMAALLQALYKLDIIEEDGVFEWNESCKDAGVRAAAKPMIDWLNQSEEESDDEDDE